MKIKLHVFEGSNDGSESCDFRGPNFIGHDQGDEHRTLAEIDNPDAATVELVLTEGPKVNRLLSTMNPAEAIGGLLGGAKIGLRIGVWPDEDNSTSG